MDRYLISLDPAASEFYRTVARNAALPVEQVLADSLYRLAGSLSLEAVARKNGKNQPAELHPGAGNDRIDP